MVTRIGFNIIDSLHEEVIGFLNLNIVAHSSSSQNPIHVFLPITDQLLNLYLICTANVLHQFLSP